MVFNCFIGNTDDHSRNHAFMYEFGRPGWRLAPAYDVLFVNGSKVHGLGIGSEGRIATLENILSQAHRFGLTQNKAHKIIDRVMELIREYEHYFKVIGGVHEQDLQLIKNQHDFML
jgi:serine/threonine-protein kinase HipA